MFTTSSARRIAVPFVIAAIVPFAMQAQETQLFTWTGRVDRQVQLTIRGTQNTFSGEANMDTRGRFRVNSTLPSRAGTLRVITETGRGSVSIVEQPSAENSYTAIIRVKDDDGGADNYRVTAYFTPENAGRYGRNDRRDDRGNDRRNDRRDDRRDARNRDNASGPVLRWQGDVDGEVLITWQAGAANARVLRGAALRSVTSRITGDAVSTQAGGISLAAREGRGAVEVVQQPSASNRYTGIIRIVDTPVGYGHYDIEASWR